MGVSLGRSFFKKKGQWEKFYKKTLNSPEHNPSKLSRSHEEKYTSNWKSEGNYSLPVKTRRQKNWNERKEKKNIDFRYHIGISVKKMFLCFTTSLCFDPTFIWLSNSILLFHSNFVLYQMCFTLNYARRNLCNVSGTVCVKFIPFETNYLC